jgi:hypothetical protein
MPSPTVELAAVERELGGTILAHTRRRFGLVSAAGRVVDAEDILKQLGASEPRSR